MRAWNDRWWLLHELVSRSKADKEKDGDTTRLPGRAIETGTGPV